MKAGFGDYVAWWGPYLVGIIAVWLSAAFKSNSERESAGEEPGVGVCPFRAGKAVGLVFLVLLFVAMYEPKGFSLLKAFVLFVGAALGLAALAYSEWRPDRRMSGSADFLAGVGAALVFMAFLRNWLRVDPAQPLLIAALGAWLPAAVVGFGLRVRKSAVCAFSLTSMVVASGVAMGTFRYADSGYGSLAAVDTLALALLIAMATSLFAGVGSKTRAPSAAGAVVIFLVAVWWLGQLLGQSLIQASVSGLCAAVGAAAAALIFLLARSAGEDERAILGRAECALFVVLILASCAAASIKWLGAYGLSLAAAGAVAGLPLFAVIADRMRQQPGRTPDFSIVLPTTAAGAIAAAVLLRVILQTSPGEAGQVMNLFQVYTIPGLIVGGTLTLIPAALMARASGAAPVGSGLLRGAVSVIAVCAVVVAVAYLWRLSGTSGLVVGIAAGVFYSVVAAALWGSDEAMADLSAGIQLFAVVAIPVVATASLNVTKGQKIAVTIIVVAVAAVAAMVSVARRAAAARNAPS